MELRKEEYSMNEIKVSVLISTYNIEAYIGECLGSIQRQELDNIEVICVDDCSTDRTVSIIKDYMAKDDRIVLIEHEKNGGPAKSRNTGCRQAKGKYIWFIDGDDYMKDGALLRLYELAENNNLDVVSFSGEAFVDKKFEEGSNYDSYRDFYKRWNRFDGIYTGPELFVKYVAKNENIGNLYLQFIRKSLYVENNLYANEDIRYGQDSPFGIYMFAKRCLCIPDVFYMRRFRPNSQVTRKKGFEEAESCMLRLSIELKLWESLELPDNINEGLKKYFQNVLGILHNIVSKGSLSEKQYKILNKYPAVKFMMEYFILNKSWYDNLSDELLDDLLREDTVVLYGAGVMADVVAGLMERHGIIHYSVVVSNKGEYDKFHGRNVFEASQWDGNWKNAVAIVAVKAPGARDKIRAFLQEKGCKQIIEP